MDQLKKLPLTSDYVFKKIFGQEENKTTSKSRKERNCKKVIKKRT